MQSYFFCIQTPFIGNPTLNLYNRDFLHQKLVNTTAPFFHQLIPGCRFPIHSRFPIPENLSFNLHISVESHQSMTTFQPTNQPTVKEICLHRVHRGKFSIRTLLNTTAFINDCVFSTTLIQFFGGPSCLSKVLLVPGKMQSL